MEDTTSSNNVQENQVFKDSHSNNSSESKVSSNEVLSKILKAKEEDNFVITNLRGKLGNNYFIFIPTKNGNKWDFVVLFDEGIISEVRCETDEEGNEIGFYIQLSNNQKKVLGIKQGRIDVILDVKVKDLYYKDIEPLYHLRLGIFDNSLFSRIEKFCSLEDDRFKLKEQYNLSIVSNGSLVNYSLKTLYDEYCELLKKFYVHEDVFYPVSFSFFCTEILREGIGYVFLLILNGLAASGKSNFLKFMLNLLPSSYASDSASTIKAAIRCMDLYSSSVFYDELDKIGQRETKKLICGILNNSIDQTGTYTIARADERKKSRQIQSFSTFGAKCIAANNLQDIEDSTISRSFLFTSLQNRKCKVFKWETVMRDNSISIETKERYIKLAQELFLVIFFNYKNFLNHINEVQKTTTISSREEDKLSLVKGILTPIYPKEELDSLIKKIRSYSTINSSEQVHKIVVTAVEYLLDMNVNSNNSTELHYRSKDIVEKLNQEIPDEKIRYSTNSPTIRNKLLEYGLIESEFKKDGKYKTYVISVDKLYSIIDNTSALYDMFGEDERLKGVSKETSFDEGNNIGEVEQIDLV